jgi:hypothetical protein
MTEANSANNQRAFGFLLVQYLRLIPILAFVTSMPWVSIDGSGQLQLVLRVDACRNHFNKRRALETSVGSS